jgi:hypothetical protein
VTTRDERYSLRGAPVRMRGPVRMGGPVRVPQPDIPKLDDLWSWQKAGVAWLRERDHALLADSMGLGKSAQVLRALPRRGRTILLAPASVLSVWEEQVPKWRPDLSVDARTELRRPDLGEIVAVSYDSLPEPHRSSSRNGKPRMLLEPTEDVTLVLDECHKVKSGDAQRTQKTRLLAAQCARVWGMTGTPMYGDPEDLWGVLVSLGLDKAVFPGGWQELVQLCGGKKRIIWDKRAKCRREAGYVWGDVSPEVKRRLRDLAMLRRTADDPEVDIQFPGVRHVDVPVRAPEELRRTLDGISEHVWAETKPGELPPFDILATARAALAESRIPAALTWAESVCLEAPLLVFSAHETPALAVGGMKLPNGYVAASLTGATPQRQRGQLVADFQAGKIRVLSMTIAAGGEGLNLYEAGRVLFIDLDYTPSMNAQAERRAARLGQKRRRVDVYRMVSDHPLDQRVLAILTEKQRVIQAAIG